MTNFIVWISGYLLIALLAGCTHRPDATVRATIEHMQENPPPVPDFISTSRLPDECIEVKQTVIWEPGDTGPKLLDHLTQSIQLTIDGDIILDAKSSIASIHLSTAPVFGGTGEIIAIVGGPITVCAESPQLANGFHLAKLEFTSTSGRLYEYSWVFEAE